MMALTKAEIRLIDWIREHIPLLFLIAVFLLGIFLRLTGIDYISRDYRIFLKPWWDEISATGIEGLARQVGDYNIPFQILIWILTRFPLDPLRTYKFLSILFDLAMAVAAALLTREVCARKSRFLPVICFGAVFCSLTVVFNSAFWAQCDSVYTAFVLFAIYYTVKDKPLPAFVMLGLAFAFKLQTVFILPFFLYHYLIVRKSSLLHFLLIPAVDFAVCLPAIVAGRPLGQVFSIYLDQTKSYPYLYLNFPSFFALFASDETEYYYLHSLGLILAFLLSGAGLAFLLYRKIDFTNREKLIFTAVWTVFTCLIFLPAMHERYAYLLDVLAILYVIIARKRYWIAVGCNLISLFGYARYLFSYDPLPVSRAALCYFALYAAVTCLWTRDLFFPSPTEKAPAVPD